MEGKKFQKKTEDFICEHCGAENVGTGYTNHCQKCLWSKHVDVYPGDRLATCAGMMEPISFVLEKGEGKIINRCVVCGYEKKNKLEVGDNEEVYITLSAREAGRKFDVDRK